MYATAMHAPPVQKSVDESFLDAHLSESSKVPEPVSVKAGSTPPARYNRDGTFREANTSIGLEAERKGVKVREYDRNDRWLAWRKRSLRVTRASAAKAARGTKAKGKKSNKGPRMAQRKK